MFLLHFFYCEGACLVFLLVNCFHVLLVCVFFVWCLLLRYFCESHFVCYLCLFLMSFFVVVFSVFMSWLFMQSHLCVCLCLLICFCLMCGQLCDWSKADSAERQLTFFRLCDVMASRLKRLFVLFATQLVKPLAAILRQTSSSGIFLLFYDKSRLNFSFKHCFSFDLKKAVCACILESILFCIFLIC